MTTTEALELAREWLTWDAWDGRQPPPPTPIMDSAGYEDENGPTPTAMTVLSKALIDLAAKCERYERVVEAAVKWKKVADDPGAPVWKYTMELDAALDALAADKATP
jgi:hypothetical protein